MDLPRPNTTTLARLIGMVPKRAERRTVCTVTTTDVDVTFSYATGGRDPHLVETYWRDDHFHVQPILGKLVELPR